MLSSQASSSFSLSSEVYSPVAAHVCLIVAFLVQHRLKGVGSVVVAHGLSCPVACGVFLDQESNPCPLHWQADLQPLDHQGNPERAFLIKATQNETPAKTHSESLQVR